MEIKRCLNTTIKEINEKRFNIFIGISLGNKFFSKKHIKDYLLWSIKNTKEKVAILIPDKIHSINYEVKSGYTKERAKKVAAKEGEKVKKTINDILVDLDLEKRDIVEILKWEDIETEDHKNMVEILTEEFSKNKRFKNLVLEIVKENIQSKKLTDFDYEKLAIYPIKELPMLISGITYKGTIYDLLPYPGISKIDYLAVDLAEGKTFPKITDKLHVKTKLKLIDAYFEKKDVDIKDVNFKIIEKTEKLEKEVMGLLHEYPKHFVHGLFEKHVKEDFLSSDIMVAYYENIIIGCVMFNRITNEFSWLAVKKGIYFSKRKIAKSLFENFYKTIEKGTGVHLFVNTEDAYVPDIPYFSGKNFEPARELYLSMGLEIKKENRVENKFGLGAHAYKVVWNIK